MQQAAREVPVLAVDLGGTKIALAVVTAEGRIIARQRLSTLAEQGPQGVVGRLLAAAEAFLSRIT